ncbi:MAG: hypothetical protein IPN29_07875 [Saprospiraceae bacterium]|nr:hypothetical protein [Saprospiraceae bacterium]
MKTAAICIGFILLAGSITMLPAQGNYTEMGKYAVVLGNGWVQTQDGQPDYYAFSKGALLVSLKKDPAPTSGNGGITQYVLVYTQALKAANEFVESSKPSNPAFLLGQTAAYRLTVKSKISGNKRFVYFITVGRQVYELSVADAGAGFEPSPEAMAFLELIYLRDEPASKTMALARAQKRNIQVGGPAPTDDKADDLSAMKKVKVYDGEAQDKGDGNVVEKANGATFTAPASSLASGEKLSIRQEVGDIDFFEGYFEEEGMKTLTDNFKMLRLYEIGPEGKKFDNPGEIEVVIPKNELPQGRSYKDIVAVMISGNEIEMVPFEVTDEGIKVKVEHCSYLAIPILILAGAATVIFGTALANIKKGSDPVFKKKCADWIDIDHAQNEPLKKIIDDPGNFKINDDGTLSLDVGKPLKGKIIGMGNHLLKPGQFIAKPIGDCVNYSNLFGCVLKAKGYQVKVVAGKAVYPDNTGGHQWLEVIYKGKPHYLDTYEPSKAKLIPLDEATKTFQLKPGTMCTETGPKSYDKNWFRGLITDKDAMLSRYKALREEHRVLNEACVAGSVPACNERREVYLEAMDLRKKLEAMGVKVVD